MARQNFLDRFRPVGAPGPSGPAAVPADDQRGPEWELAPVFAALASTIEANDAAIRRADDDAKARIAAAALEAKTMVERTALDADAARAAAAAGLLAESAANDAGVMAAAQKRASALNARARTRMPEATTRVISALVAEIGES